MKNEDQKERRRTPMHTGRIVIGMVFAVLLVVFTAACSSTSNDTTPRVADDEIALDIRLDIKEDIGLLVVDYEANGTSGSGGTSNADKSLLKRGERILYTLSKQNFDDPADVENLSVKFTVITEYVDPNYDNVYPAEYTKPMDAISLKGKFGEAYHITIRGDKTNGYHAVWEG
ncbi:MAG: hypothetical protein ACI4WZ_00675 [Eubacteriales bacterium]